MSFSAFDHQCMAEALRLAALGLSSTQPNPRVGCVVAKDGQLIGRGFHQRAGEAHAEIFALREAGAAARGATAYVTLEPCSHHGRTPPCAEALLAAGVTRVVIAMQDPHTVVNGAGARLLQEAGVTVESGLMQAEAEDLNPGFLQRMRHGRPWVRVKLAASLDGRTALASGESQWISSEASRRDVQHWRARSSAILTGIGTVLADDPQMTVRLEGVEHQPVRVIADSRWRTPATAKILQQPGRVIIAGCETQLVPVELEASPAQLLRLPAVGGKPDLNALMKALAKEQVNELQVEAGAGLCGALLRQRLVDEVLLYQAPVILGEGGQGLFAALGMETMQDKYQLNRIESRYFGPDQRLRMRPVFNTGVSR